MDQYCVVLCGLRADAPTASEVWPPVAAALKLDQVEFAQRVIAAMPLIVRRELDRASAERIVELMQAMHVEARALPDDEQLVYIRHEQATSGPLPQSALADFIAPGDSWQLRGSTPWLPWPAAVVDEPTPAPIPVNGADVHDSADSIVPVDEVIETPADEFIDEPIEAAAPPLADDEHEHEETTGAMSFAAPAEDFTAVDEVRHVLPPPLPEPSSPPDLPPAPEAAASAEPAAIAAASDADARMPGDELDHPSDEASMPVDPDMDVAAGDDASDAAPATRSRGGRLLVLLLLAGLAYWAYVHWIADTSNSQPPGAVATAPSPKPAATDKLDVPAKAAATTDAKPAAAASLAAATSAAIPAASSTAAPTASSSAAPASSAAASSAPTSASSAPAAAGSAKQPH